ncbi:hypothetical protein CsSME_00021481 [Camellia sinensis var. sinensis]
MGQKIALFLLAQRVETVTRNQVPHLIFWPTQSSLDSAFSFNQSNKFCSKSAFGEGFSKGGIRSTFSSSSPWRNSKREYYRHPSVREGKVWKPSFNFFDLGGMRPSFILSIYRVDARSEL